MTATYKVDVDEKLSADILQSIKEAFKGKTVDIVVTESVGDDVDETEYLLGNPNNKKFLDESFAELDAGKGIKFSVEELKEKYGIK